MERLDAALAGPEGATSLRAHLGPGGVVVYFMRDFGCHTCVGLARAFVARAEEVRSLGFGLVVVGGGSPDQAARVRWGADVPVLADPTHQAYEAFGLDRVWGYWQRSGVFVVDQAGEVVFGDGAVSPKKGMDLSALMGWLGTAGV